MSKVRVGGFRVQSFTGNKPNKKFPQGSLKIVLVADNEEIGTLGDDSGKFTEEDVIGAINIHATSEHPISLELDFSDS